MRLLHVLPQLVWVLACLGFGLAGEPREEDSTALKGIKSLASRSPEECLSVAFPKVRADFPKLLNCLGLHGEAVEVGVQAGVHASDFINGWDGRRLRLVDLWSSQGDASGNRVYIDIANIHGADIRKEHRAQCEARMAEALRHGRAEIVNSDSTFAAAQIPDGDLDFVYLDARHDFAGVVADIRAWWPKVRVGGIFAGHDFVDGEFPEGDFFWISALRAVLPGIENRTRVTEEKDRFPSFFILKTAEMQDIVALSPDADAMALSLYRLRSKYFNFWRSVASDGVEKGAQFNALCRSTCQQDCDGRAQEFTPTRMAGSTLRPFACVGSGASTSVQTESVVSGASTPDVCATEMVVDVQAYRAVCLERCNITCQQREELFSTFGADILAV